MASNPEPAAQVSEETLEKIRDVFLEKYKENINNGSYHPLDLERVKKNTNWIRAFYKHAIGSADKAADLAHEVLTWRKENDANSLLTPGKLPFSQELIDDGGLFYHNKDKQGRPILFFAVRKYKKGKYSAEQNRKYIAYFLEKMYKFDINHPIVLFFDFNGAGMSGADLEMSKFLVMCLKTYYAGLIEYVIIFDIPFVFSAIWKVIRLLLPTEAIELVKFVDKKTVRDYVNEDQLFTHLGGTDKFVYDKNDPALYVTEADLQAQ